MDDLILRELRDEDVAELQEIAVAAWEPVFASFHRLVGPEIFAIVYTGWRDEIREQIGAECRGERGAKMVVAEVAGRPVGFAGYYLNPKTRIGEISNNAVHPGYQNRGIATRMYECVLGQMRAAGMRVAQVGTGGDPSHAPARRAYQKVGFERGIPSVTYFMDLGDKDES